MKDLTITGLGEDRPGIVAAIGEALGRGGVNIEGSFGVAKLGEVHVLVEDAETARRAVEQAGFRVSEERDALVAEIEDRPGSLGELTRRIADAGVSIDFHYLATHTRVVVCAAELEKAREAARQVTAVA